MAPRTILHTGKGGAGTTCVAAATAWRCAAAGHRTLLLSADPARGLAAALGTGPEPRPALVCDRLWAQQVAPPAELERLADAGIPLPPGLDELLGLLVLRGHHDAGSWDVVVVDGVPAAGLLRLLAVPEAARRWLAGAAAQPGRLLDDLGALARGLVALGDVLRDRERCSVRLVLSPDAAGIADARRTATGLALHGVVADAVVANRVLPPEAGAYFGPWRARQQERLRAVEEDFAPVPVLRAPWFEEEVAGPAMLDRLGATLFGADADPAAVLHARAAERLVVGRDGATLRLELPFATREALRLERVEGDLVVTVDGHRRALALPPALADYRASGARFEDGALHITFDPPA